MVNKVDYWRNLANTIEPSMFGRLQNRIEMPFSYGLGRVQGTMGSRSSHAKGEFVGEMRCRGISDDILP